MSVTFLQILTFKFFLFILQILFLKIFLFEVVSWNVFSVLFENVRLERGLLIEFVVFSN